MAPDNGPSVLLLLLSFGAALYAAAWPIVGP